MNVLLPVLAKQTLAAGPATFGIVTACFGAGALVGALVAAGVGQAALAVHPRLGRGVRARRARDRAAPERRPGGRAALRLRHLLHDLHRGGQLVGPARHARPPARPGARCLFYAWTAPLPLASPLIGWLCTVGGTELAFAFGGLCALPRPARRRARGQALAARNARAGLPSSTVERLPRARRGSSRPGFRRPGAPRPRRSPRADRSRSRPLISPSRVCSPSTR